MAAAICLCHTDEMTLTDVVSRLVVELMWGFVYVAVLGWVAHLWIDVLLEQLNRLLTQLFGRGIDALLSS